MRPKATRSPLGSTTATFIAQPRLVASSTAALTSACARSIEIGVPKGILNGILSGMAFRSGGAGGAAGAGCCCAMAWPAANKPAASVNTVKVRDFIWVSSLIGGVFSAAIAILDEKKRPVSAKFEPSARYAFRGASWRRGRSGGSGSKNNLSTMRAEKQTRCAADRLRHCCHFCPTPRRLLLRRRSRDVDGGDRCRRALSPQAVDATCKRWRTAAKAALEKANGPVPREQ